MTPFESYRDVGGVKNYTKKRNVVKHVPLTILSLFLQKIKSPNSCSNIAHILEYKLNFLERKSNRFREKCCQILKKSAFSEIVHVVVTNFLNNVEPKRVNDFHCQNTGGFGAKE